MRSAAAAAWARRVGIDTTGKPTWKVQITLLTTGELPTAIANPRESYFFLQVEAELWCIDVNHGGKRYLLAQLGAGAPTISGALAVPSRPTLATVATWLATFERTHDIAFRRDRPFVQSTIKGGKPAAVAWIATL